MVVSINLTSIQVYRKFCVFSSKCVQNIFKKLPIRLGTTRVKVFHQPSQKQQFYSSDHELNIKHSQLQTKHQIVLFKSLTYP